MKAKLLAIAVTLTATLVLTATAIGGSPLVFAQALAVGTMQATTVKTGSGAMVLDSITIRPGGSFGWHSHPAPVAVVVTAGVLTVTDPSIGNCKPFTVSKGQAFIEPANHPHLARNEGQTPVRVYALYLGVPKNATPNKPLTAPAGCRS